MNVLVLLGVLANSVCLHSLTSRSDFHLQLKHLTLLTKAQRSQSFNSPKNLLLFMFLIMPLETVPGWAYCTEWLCNQQCLKASLSIRMYIQVFSTNSLAVGFFREQINSKKDQTFPQNGSTDGY